MWVNRGGDGRKSGFSASSADINLKTQSARKSCRARADRESKKLCHEGIKLYWFESFRMQQGFAGSITGKVPRRTAESQAVRTTDAGGE